MSAIGLNHQVEAFYQWKKSLISDIKLYQSWLRKNQLNSEDLETKLRRNIRLLEDDSLTIAFVGEYSRGKTELINALFFAEFGQRMLPSQAGRTTMCPTELFYDHQGGGYLKLLPIDTRKADTSLVDLKKTDEPWFIFHLDENSPDSMLRTLDQLAQTIEVSLDEASALGFEVASLERAPDNPELCLVPAWRHALISLDNPILQQGLKILDTPGLNALGAEPELTISMIPSAHAIIFLLGVDTGVTASDLDMWHQFIDHENAGHIAGRFAVMNKIDMLWDDIQGEQSTEAAIEKVRQKTALQLNIPQQDVLLTSAKQALIAKVKNDEELLFKSRISGLEKLLSEQVLSRKEQIISYSLVNDILGMLQNSQTILQSRRHSMKQRLQEQQQKGVSKDFITSLHKKTRDEYDYYYKQLFTLRSSRRLMTSQAEILSKSVNKERFEEKANKTRDMLVNSWTTLGMAKAMSKFFVMIESDLRNLDHEARLAQKMVKSIFARYANDPKTRHLHPAKFNINRYIRELKALQQRAETFRRNPTTVMSEQTVVVKRFFATMVSEARALYAAIEEETQRWSQEALLPLIQYTTEQKQILEHQIIRVKELTSSARDNRSQTVYLRNFLEELDQQLQEAKLLQSRLQAKPPAVTTENVFNFHGMAG